MPINIPENFKKEYLDYFWDETKFKNPSRNYKEYNIADDYFSYIFYAKKSLILLLEQISQIPFPKKKLEQNVYTEFTVTAHAKVRKAPGQDDEIKLLVGQTALMLEKGKEGTHKAKEQSKNADPNSLVITSDLARAIHHGLLKYCPEIEDELYCFADKIDEEFRAKGGVISRDAQFHLVKLALDHGIIPTPLLRSHYHGARDLTPEKYEHFIIDDYFKSDICRNLYKEKSEDEVRAILTLLRNMAEQGKSPFQIHEDEDGKILTEDLLLYTDRISHLLQLFAPGQKLYSLIKGMKVNLIGHSSNIDVITAYFRHFGEELRLVVEKTDKVKTRGNEIVIKVDHEFVYLNDPHKIELIRNCSLAVARDQRKASLDEKIKNAREKESAIIPVELLRFEKKSDSKGNPVYESHNISVDDIVESPEPALWLANFGQGKSTAAIELTEKLNTKGQYVTVLITARDINEGLLNALGQDTKENDKIILDILSKGVTSLSAILRNDYRFVFIIDALDEVTNYRENVIHILKDAGQLRDYGKIIVTSRFTGFDNYENPGFLTFHLDSQAVIRNIDRYLELRITEQTKRSEFKDFLLQQDDAIKTTYLLVYFLTNIYIKRPSELDWGKKVISEGDILICGIEIALWDHKLTKGSKLQIPKPYSGQTEEEARALREQYETTRKTHLSKWMNLLQRVASYMTVQDKRTITKSEIEDIVSNDWTLAKYVDELKRK